ncbi:MAG: DinB family protein [Saprospiraceae bacterium]|nr:DinB family protein [Saprospiraceae bacterium]
MTKQEIIHKLNANHKLFGDYMDNLSESDFLFCHEDKWSAGQQFDHICRSVQPLSLALLLPKWVIKLWIGKANRPSKSYDELVQKYKLKLAEGGKASGRFVPLNVELNDRDNLSAKLKRTMMSLTSRLDKYSESDMDIIILPHPLLGKLTLREMMYFTIYHVLHHQESAMKNITFR